MAWTLEYKKNARRQLRKLDATIADRILTDMEYFASQTEPRVFAKSLTGNWQGLWRFRIGDYRAICHIDDGMFVILVVKIGHRKEIYS